MKYIRSNHPVNQTDTQKITELLVEILECRQSDAKTIANYYPAKQLKKKLDLKLAEKGAHLDEVVEYIKQYLHYMPDASHPGFNKLLYSGTDAIGVLGEWIASLSNATMHTYQVAPVATLMEQELIQQLNQLIGFNGGDGIMVSGGTMANMVSMMLARFRAIPAIKEHGVSAQPPLVAYVSELSHYSYQKAANTLGIGTNNLVAVDTDNHGQMRIEILDKAIQKSLDDGKQPFYIGLTAGTTILGSFDPVRKASELARRYKLWLHIDGAWGGPVLFSPETRHLLDGCEQADSFAWDAHKLMNLPLSASLILVRDPEILEACCSSGGGDYLFHEDENSAYNLGKKSLQCGRRTDSLKFWLSWKEKGTQGYRDKVEYLLELKDYAVSVIDSSPKLKLLAPSPYLNVLFRYEPDYKISNDKLAQLNVEICKVMLRENLGFVDYARYKEHLGIRYILANQLLTHEHVDNFLKHCLDVGDRLNVRY